MTAGLSNEANALLERAKKQGGPSAEQTTKIGAAVFAATTASAATATATVAATTTAAAGTSSLITIVGAGLVATALGIGGTVAVKHTLAPPSEQPRPRVAPPSVRVPPPVQPIVVAPGVPSEPGRDKAPEPGKPAVSAPRAERVELKPAGVAPEVKDPVGSADTTPDEPAPPTSGRHAAPPVDSTAAQVAALAAAVEALERHQPELARTTARDARLADPDGVLSPELMVVEITALCELGRRDDALGLSRQMTSAEQTPLVRGKLGRTCVGTGE